MPIKIQGTQKQDSGGWGLGSLLGKVAGGIAGAALAPVTGGASLLAAGSLGSSLGGALGGAVGGAIDGGENKEMGVEVKGARDSGFQAPAPKTSAIDRLNSIVDTGMSVANGVQGAQNLLKAPTIGGASNAIQRRMSNFNQMNAGY